MGEGRATSLCHPTVGLAHTVLGFHLWLEGLLGASPSFIPWGTPKIHQILPSKAQVGSARALCILGSGQFVGAVPPSPRPLHTMDEIPSSSSSWIRFTGFRSCCRDLLCRESCQGDRDGDSEHSRGTGDTGVQRGQPKAHVAPQRTQSGRRKFINREKKVQCVSTAWQDAFTALYLQCQDINVVSNFPGGNLGVLTLLLLQIGFLNHIHLQGSTGHRAEPQDLGSRVLEVII